MALTKQEVFDKVAVHLLKQGKRSMGKVAAKGINSACKYRGDGGTMCAVGCLIPDSVYTKSMEGTTVGYLLLEHPGFEGLFSEEVLDNGFLNQLQRVHDFVSPEHWAFEFDLLAKQNKLNASIISSFEEHYAVQ